MSGGAEPDREWTVAVWVAGDNNLESFGASDLAEMKKVGSTDKVAVVAQYDRMSDQHTRRYHVQQGTSLDADAVQDLGETNTGDPAVAIDFFTWAITTFPAKKVLAVLWNHGSGIDETDIYARAAAAGPGNVPRGNVRQVAASAHKRALIATTVDRADLERAIAYDDSSRDFLDNKELQQVLADVVKATGKKIDIVGFDACLMNMVEVGYQLKDSVDYIVGSEETEPGDGWPYQAQLETLNTSADAAAEEIAPKLVENYLHSYQGSGEAVTQSAVDVSHVDQVAQATKALATACVPLIGDRGGYSDFSKAVKNAQRFQMKDFADLGDLCTLLEDGCADASVKAAAANVKTTLFNNGKFVLAAGNEGEAVKGATGTSIYFPVVGDVHVVYDQLSFSKETGWGNLISTYQQA
jgi:hypothetical protein